LAKEERRGMKKNKSSFFDHNPGTTSLKETNQPCGWVAKSSLGPLRERGRHSLRSPLHPLTENSTRDPVGCRIRKGSAEVAESDYQHAKFNTPFRSREDNPLAFTHSYTVAIWLPHGIWCPKDTLLSLAHFNTSR